MRKQRRLGLLAAAALAMRLGAAAAGGAAAPTRVEVETILKQEGPEQASELRRLATTAEPILIAIADDRALDPTVRGRAVAAFAYTQSARSHTFLENLILRRMPSSDPVDRLLVRRAAVALGWQSGSRVVDIVAPLLDHADPDVRTDAAVALGLCRARAGEAPLRARLSQESDPNVRRQIDAALRTITR
jgi:HEAT repeat protein